MSVPASVPRQAPNPELVQRARQTPYISPARRIIPHAPVNTPPHFGRRAFELDFLHMKTIHIAEMIADGGRDGTVEAPDGKFSVALSSSEAPESVTPEHLFAGAYAACFLGALQNAAEMSHRKKIEGATVLGRAHLEED